MAPRHPLFAHPLLDPLTDLDALEETLEHHFSDPALLRDGTAVSNARARLTAIETEITAQLARWEELETIATG